MATLTKRSENSRGATGLGYLSSFQERDYEAANLEALKGIVSYLKYLYMEREISEKAYQALVSQALSNFVENSVRLKVEQMFGEVDVVLQGKRI